MPASLDRALRLLFIGLAVAFAVTGLLFAAFPDGTIRLLNASGSAFGFPPAPESALRFWLSLGLAYMMLVTLLAAAIARDPRGRAPLMPILAAGKATSSLTCVGYFLASGPAFIYLVNALVDGSIALGVMGAWALVTLTGDRARARDDELLRIVLDALVPRKDPSVADGQLDGAVSGYFARLHPLGPLGLGVLLRAIEYGGVVFERTRPFSQLDAAARERALAAWERSRLGLRRQLVASLKLIAFLHFYERPETWPEIGYDDGWLRRKLLAGPNAAHHAARLGTVP